VARRALPSAGSICYRARQASSVVPASPETPEERLMDSEQAGRSEQAGAPTRRSYEPPRITFEEDFQPYAFSTCGKMAGQGGICNVHRNS